ncbi:MAG: hypothetical protein KA100_01780 [Rickettsiales bacterium]|nr:hypothetical protein [Rickettsiales bacterium]
MSSFFSKNQIEKIVSIALEAGEIAALAFKEKNFTIKKKSDHSQVTSADIAVSKFLHDKLSQEFSQIPIICEEGDLREISDEVFFLIDPIDGTSSFVSDSVEFSVNIALVKDKKAIFGLIYAPLFEGGRMIFSNHKNQIIDRDFNGEQKILNATELDLSELRIITSARTKDVDIANYIEQIHPDFSQNFVVEKLSSAIKFFRLLEGKSNLYLHFRPSMEWDTAAGQALVELMDGKVKKLFFNQNEIEIGENLDYKKPNFANKAFVAII